MFTSNHFNIMYSSPSYTFHVDIDGLLTFPIRACIKEVMHVQTLAVLGAIPRPLLQSGVVMGQRPTQIAISPSSHLRLRCS